MSEERSRFGGWPDMTAEEIAEAAARARAELKPYRAPMHIPKPAATPHDEHLARARARIEQEKRK